MHIAEIATYAITFIALYVQLFLFLTFIERRKEIVYKRADTDIKIDEYPTVTIIVPCWNEARTLAGTVASILALDYPQDKLTIFLIDDGSKDNTWELMQEYKKYPNIEIFKKENGGKHTAVNLGIANAKSEFMGCLDADSFAEPGSLKRIMTYFIANPTVMAVSPSVVVSNPKKILEKAQRADYNMAAFIKKVYSMINGMHVAAGAFTIFRKRVFDEIGLYKNAYNTEDYEITLRMYANHFRIEQCNDAYVYTVPPSTVKGLFKQRLRWMYGFIKNTYDYRFMLFKKEYGTVAVFTLPAGVLSIFTVIYLFALVVTRVINFIIQKITVYHDTGKLFHFGAIHFDWFFVTLQTTFFLIVFMYSLVVISVLIGKKISGEKPRLSMDILYFICIYMVLAPAWLLKAIYNAVVGKSTSWR